MSPASLAERQPFGRHALEDGDLTEDEAADLGEIASIHELSDTEITGAHRAFVRALAHEALTDGKVTRSERAELMTVAELLAVSDALVPEMLATAEAARNSRMSQKLPPLPDDRSHGEPLRVGDKVVFTGCDPTLRTKLENKSESLGVRVLNTVSAKTALLVTDHSVDGGKAVRAAELGTRTVTPAEYDILLKYLQPSRPRPPDSEEAPGHTCLPP